MIHFCFQRIISLLAISAFFLSTNAPCYSQDTSVEEEPTREEPTYIDIKGAGSIEDISISTYASPVDQLQYSPIVDVQSRGFVQAQSDVSIRGNTFDQTGVLLGAVPLFDPQTGHYSFEIPIPPHVFAPAEVLTANDFSERLGLGAGGAVAYTINPIVEGGFARAGLGDFRLNTQEVSEARTLAETDYGTMAGEMSFGHSSSNGSLPNSGHEFYRYFARAGLSAPGRDTQILYGIQQKDFRWPNLYALQELHTLVGSSGIEGDNLNTSLLAINHSQKLSNTDEILATAYYRRNHDDYDFDHFNPQLFNAFRHTTKTFAAGASYKHESVFGTFRYQAAVLGDEIDSTSLVFGPYSSRVQGIASSTYSRSDLLTQTLSLNSTAGVRTDLSNRNKDTLAPIAYLGLQKSYERFVSILYTSYSQSSAVPGYTALSSNAGAGLFRGNPFLSRTVSKSAEAGLELTGKKLSSKSAFFSRRDNDLVDWVYDSTLPRYAARNARNLDLDTYGFEQTLTAKLSGGTQLQGGYTYIEKNPSYATSGGDASFYALNFPRQRFFAKAEAALNDYATLLGTLEWRDQYPSSLRDSSSQSYLLSSAGLKFGLSNNWSIEVLAENLGNENFEEVAGVPSSKRTAGLFTTVTW